MSGPPRALCLIAITDRAVASAEETLRRFERVARAARPGSVAFQLRDRELSARERLAFGRELGALARGAGQLLQVNDRLDLAALLGADAVHLGEGGVATADARRVVGPNVWISRACHDATRAADVDADLLVLSPVVAARKGNAALGSDGLRSARALLERAGRETPLFALGGVDAPAVAACLSAGAQGVAVIGAVLGAAEPERIVHALGVAR